MLTIQAPSHEDGIEAISILSKLIEKYYGYELISIKEYDYTIMYLDGVESILNLKPTDH